MKRLTFEEIELVNGGNNATDILDFACGGAGAALAVMTVVKIATGPVGNAIGAACSVYGLGRVLSWW